MYRHKNIVFILILTIVFIPFIAFAAGTSGSNPFGGKVSFIIPAPKVAAHENMCVPNLKYCMQTGIAIPTEAEWQYAINERRTFALTPDRSPQKGNTYYIPDGVRAKVGTLSSAKNILGLYSKKTTNIGSCTCTYTTYFPVPTTFTVVTPVSETLATVNLWGTSR